MNLEALRRRMDEIDAELLCLFEQRMRVAAQIGQYKQRHRLPITDAAREQDKLRDVASKLPEELPQPHMTVQNCKKVLIK